jgi:EpsD family peptidyl-prolyl cis-trans isomerase
MRDRWNKLFRLTILVGLCGLALSGCDKKEQGAASQSQDVAHVGNGVVTTQELENEFRLANIPPDKQKDPAIVKQVLGELVLRKYLVQQALDAKLDREPGVLLEILRSRDVVLASSFVSRAVAAKPITQSEVDKYIAANPLKFANRQLLSVDEIVFQLGANAQAVVEASKEAKSLEEVDQQLNAMGIAHNRTSGNLDSAEMSEDFFNGLEAKKADNVFFVRSGPNGVFFKVTGQTTRPLQGEAAAGVARRLLRADRIKAETGIASVSANLEAKYEGDYASIMKSQDSPGKN